MKNVTEELWGIPKLSMRFVVVYNLVGLAGKNVKIVNGLIE